MGELRSLSEHFCGETRNYKDNSILWEQLSKYTIDSNIVKLREVRTLAYDKNNVFIKNEEVQETA